MHNFHKVVNSFRFGQLEGTIWVESQELHWIAYVIEKVLPECNTLPKNHYEVKKILCPVGIEYQKIHACSNDYILYKNHFA